MPEFPCTLPLTAIVQIDGGVVEITAEERTTALVDVSPYDDSEASRTAAANAVVELRGDALTIVSPNRSGGRRWRRSGRLRVTARIPADCRLVLRLASANARCAGRYASVLAANASGYVMIEEVTGDLRAKMASGDLIADRIGGNLALQTASGRVRVGIVGGHAGTHGATGDIEIGTLNGSLRAVTASGDVRVGQLHRGAVRVKSASGDVTLGVVAGTAVWLDLTSSSGAVHSDLATTPAPPSVSRLIDLNVQVRSASGDIEVRRVLPAGGAADGVATAA